MRSFQLFVFLILLLPSFAEMVDAKTLIIEIPGIPFSVGRITFLILGLIGFFTNRKFYFESNTFKGLILIFLGTIMGSLFSNQVGSNLSRSIGNFTLLFGAVGVASLIVNDVFKKVISLFFVFNFFYWAYYTYSITSLNGLQFTSYSLLFNQGLVINHHVVGVNISVSSLFIAINFFYKNNKLSLWGYLILFVGVFVCFLSETRSNILFTVLCSLLLIYYSNLKLSRLLTITIPLLLLMGLVIIGLAETNDYLYQRFDVTDQDYQKRTTFMRLDFINLFFSTFLNNPLGKGLLEIEISTLEFESSLLHNQYLTFILAGGFISLAGIFLWVRDVFSLSKFYLRNSKVLSVNSFNYAVLFSIISFMLTLLTIEYSGLLFYLLLSLLVYLGEYYYNLNLALKMRK